MKYGKYLLEHKIWGVIFLCFLCSVEVFLLTFSNSEWLMIYVAAAGICAFFVGTYVEYQRWKVYFDNINRCVEELDRKYLLPELLEPGNVQEKKEIESVLYEMEVSMNENVSSYRRNSQEYKEYVESWVHEIKVPIGAMKMILANHKEEDYGLEEEVNRLEGYVEQALFYARSSDVEKDYLINRISLQQVVQDAILKKRKILRNINAAIDLHDLETEVNSDSKWLGFMLGQVLDNSIKYVGEKQLMLEIYGEKHENSILLHIKDNGIGIKESELSRVFDKGFTGSNGRGTANSTGIGMYLCRKLCHRLEHNILIDSKVGEGTIITFVFPVSNMIHDLT